MTSRLGEIQRQLKANKSEYNQFGHFPYRTAEGILEAVKPLLNDDESITLSDDLVMIGDRYYVRAKAEFYSLDVDGVKIRKSTAYAREPLEMKGMSEPQITGACSSYARKYALCGLFAIDDSNDDPDTKEQQKPQKAARKAQQRQQAQADANKGSSALDKARAALNVAIEKWAAATGADAKKSKAGIKKRPDYAPTIEFYNKAAAEFAASTPAAADMVQLVEGEKRFVQDNVR